MMRGLFLASLLLLSGCGFGSSSNSSANLAPASPASMRMLRTTGSAEVGRVISGDTAAIPLPPGDWEQAYHFTSGPYERFGYLLVDHDKAPIFVHVGRNTAKKEGGFPVDPACYPGPKIAPAAVDLSRGERNNWDCMIVWPALGHTEAEANKDPGLAVELESLAHYGPRPKYVVGARLIAGYKGNIVSLDFEFFPSQDGVNGESWTSDNQTPAEKAYIDSIVSWASRFRGDVVAAAKGEL